MADFIQLEKDDVLRLEIRDKNGNSIGEYLEFDLEDVELPLKYQELLEKDKKNKEYLRNQFLIIDKRKDIKGKKLMSKNEEDKIRAIRDFFNKEKEIYDMFLGKGGVDKLLNGRSVGWTTFEGIDRIIEQQILPHLDLSMTNITDKIKNKYKDAIERNKEVLK